MATSAFRWSSVCVALLFASTGMAQVQNTQQGEVAKERAQFEQQKDNITYASEYINKDKNGPKKDLLQSAQKHDDALSVKPATN